MHEKERYNHEYCRLSDEYYEILTGLKNELSIEQVKFYAVGNFNNRQMEAIRRGFENGLTKEQIEIYAKESYGSNIMEELYYCFMDGMSITDVKKLSCLSLPDINKKRHEYNNKKCDIYKLLCEKLLD